MAKHSFEAFTSIVCDQLDVDPEAPRHQSASVFEDWALDSLEAFRLIILVEAMAEADVPPPTIPEIFTAGDAYGYYCSLISDGSVLR